MGIKRDRWPSRAMFVFAAVGSAVGLGNIWRFPYLVGKYGGGAFLLPYIIALFLVGFPLLVMEFALGQKMQQGAIRTMGKINKRLSGVGLGAVLSSYGVSCYYAVVLGWCIIYALYSLNLAWANDPEAFFSNEVLKVSASANQIDGFSLPVLCALIISWVMVYFCLWRGVKSVSRIVQITMPLPVILLIILLSRTMFLPGALEGIRFYLRPNISALLDLDVWMAAISQIFFTLTLGFGVMITYASYQHRKSDIVKNALITSLADAAIAITAGFVVFSTLGYISQTSGKSITELAATGPSLAFVVFPRALSLIPGAMVFSIIFFLMLITLAIDSLFSLVEAVVAVLEDHFPKVSKKKIVFSTCFLGLLGGFVFTTKAGIYYLDISDHFLTNFGLVFMGLLQAISVGWFYGAKKMRCYINEVSEIRIGKVWDFAITYFIPTGLFFFLGQTFIKNLRIAYGGYPTWALWSFGWGIVLCILLASVSYSYFSTKKG